jgi:hypothetical protein
VTDISMPKDSIRGRIRAFLEAHADKLGDNVLEVGSRIHDPDCWYLDNRYLAKGKWTGVDIQEGEGVDLVCDVSDAGQFFHAIEFKQFSGIVCSEVLEHCKRPWNALKNLCLAVESGGYILMTAPFGFHQHGYPSDYYRYTDDGLKYLLENAGFSDVKTEYHGNTVLTIKNHEEKTFDKNLPMQLFAIARKS